MPLIDPQTIAKPIGVTTRRPKYVPADFAGKCKVFPRLDKLFLDYQRFFIEDPNRLQIAEKPRQVGWTYSAAYKVVQRKSRKKRKGNLNDAWITSRDSGMAQLFIEDMKGWARTLDPGARDLGEQVIDEKGTTTQQLAFANGLRAHSMSSNFNAQAGKRGMRVADEFALHEQQRQLYAIMYPGITWEGPMVIFSTHRGSGSVFNQLIQEVKHKGNPKGFSLHSVTLQDVLDQGFLYKLQTRLPDDDPRLYMDEAAYFDAVRAECVDEESFLQEYMCIPGDDAGAFLEYDLITACEYRTDEHWHTDLADSNDPLYVGVDVGRDHDLTVIWVLERHAGHRFTRRIIEMQDRPFDYQEHALDQILQLPQVRRCCIDATGLGRQFAERAQQRFGTSKVEQVKFTLEVKSDLAYPLRAAFEDRTVHIPGEPRIRADLRAIKKEVTASGNIRFTADRGKNGHADRFWALALALHAGKTANDGPVHAELATSTRANHDHIFPTHLDNDDDDYTGQLAGYKHGW